jgi:hypothetical protein
LASSSRTRCKSGRLTVVVQDNGPLHKSHLVRLLPLAAKASQHWAGWQEKGLLIFFLPPYCSEMNPIETEWHQLKSHEICGQMFDNEYDLAKAVMAQYGSVSGSIKNNCPLNPPILGEQDRLKSPRIGGWGADPNLIGYSFSFGKLCSTIVGKHPAIAAIPVPVIDLRSSLAKQSAPDALTFVGQDRHRR